MTRIGGLLALQQQAHHDRNHGQRRCHQDDAEAIIFHGGGGGNGLGGSMANESAKNHARWIAANYSG